MIRTREHSIDVVVVLCLFLLFLVLSLLLTLFGARAYQNVVSDMDGNYELRASLSYVSNKLHATDAQGCVSLGDELGVDALALRLDGPDGDYATYLYYYEGSLREICIQDGLPFALSDAAPIVALADFTIRREEDAYVLTALSSDGRELSTRVILRTGGDGV